MVAQVVGPTDLRRPQLTLGARFTPQININVAKEIGRAGAAQASAIQSVFDGLGKITGALADQQKAERLADFELDLIKQTEAGRQEAVNNAGPDGQGLRTWVQGSDDIVNNLADKYGLSDSERNKYRIGQARREIPFTFRESSRMARSHIQGKLEPFVEESASLIESNPEHYDRVLKATETKLRSMLGNTYRPDEAASIWSAVRARLEDARNGSRAEKDPRSYLDTLDKLNRKYDYDESGNPGPALGGKYDLKYYKKNVSFARPRSSGTRIAGVVIHHTEGSTTLEGNISWGNKTNTGAHAYVARDGTVHEVVRDDYRTNHAGKGRTSRHDLTNENTLAIEIMTPKGGKPTVEQLEAATNWVRAKQEKHGFSSANVVGHGEVARGHRHDDEGLAVAENIRGSKFAGRMNLGGPKEGDAEKSVKVASASGDTPELKSGPREVVDSGDPNVIKYKQDPNVEVYKQDPNVEVYKQDPNVEVYTVDDKAADSLPPEGGYEYYKPRPDDARPDGTAPRDPVRVSGSLSVKVGKGGVSVKVDPKLKYQYSEVTGGTRRGRDRARAQAVQSLYNDLMSRLEDASTQSALTGKQTLIDESDYARAKRWFSPTQFSRFDAKYKQINQTATLRRHIDTMTEFEGDDPESSLKPKSAAQKRREYIDGLAPSEADKERGHGLAEKQSNYAMAAKANAEYEKGLATKPLETLLGTSRGLAAYKAFSEAKSVEARQEALDEFIALQRDQGVALGNVRIATDETLRRYSNALRGTGEREAYLRVKNDIDSTFGKHAGSVWTELRRHEDVPREYGAMPFATSRGQALIMHALQRERQLRDGDAKANAPTKQVPSALGQHGVDKDEARKVPTAVEKALSPHLDVLFARRGQQADDILSAANLLAYYHMREGGVSSAAEAAKKAAEQVVGGAYVIQNKGGYKYAMPKNLPVGVNPAAVEQGVSRLQQYLRLDSVRSQIQPNVMFDTSGLDEKVFQNNYAYQAISKGRLMPSPDSSGFYLVDHNNRQVMTLNEDEELAPLVFPWRELEMIGKANFNEFVDRGDQTIPKFARQRARRNNK